MELVLVIAFFVLLVGVWAYTLITHFSTSRSAKGGVLIVCALISLPLLGLALYALISSAVDPVAKIWAMGVAALIAGFWLKNPARDFAQG